LARTAVTTLLAAAVLVAVAAPLSTQDEAQVDANVEGAVTRSPEAAGGPHGMRIHLDEQGRPTLPPANATRTAVQASQSSAVQTAAPVDLVELDTPRGGKMVVLDGAFQPYSVARIRPDGTVAVGCERSGDHGHAGGGRPAACTTNDHESAAPHATGVEQ
jgi:hypothetical protein